LTANNDSTGSFQLNSLVFANTGSGNVNVTGNPFQLSANGTVNPTITFANVATLFQRVSNALQLDAPLTVNQPGATTANSILDGVISGTSGMTKSGTGYVYLTGMNNSFSGGVTVGSGTLVVGNIGMAGSNSSLGTSGTIVLGGTDKTGTLRWGDYATGNEVSDKAITLPSTTGGTIDVRGNNLLTLNGNIDTGANTSLRNLNLYSSGEYVNPDGTSNSIVINGLISGNGGLSITGTGTSHTYVLNNIDNSFGGPLSLVGSTSGGFYRLRITKFGNAGAISSIGTSGVVNIGGTHASANNMLYYWGSGEDTDKTLNLSGTVGSAAIVNKGAGTLKFINPVTATGSGNKTIFPDEDELTGVIEFAGNIPDSLGGTTAIKKSGVGKLVLSASNSFTGGMRLAGGTLELKQAFALATGNYLRFETQANNGVALVKIGYAGNGPDLDNLEVRVDSTIDLGTDPTASIRFATATGWYAGKILTVANSTGGGRMYILNSAGLDLSQIKSAENLAYEASLAADGLLSFAAPAPANTAPTITSGGTFSVSENSAAVTTVVATDAEANALTYSISVGSDADKFWIDSSTGALTFLPTPDYESPTDLGANNVYNLTVVVSDGLLTAQRDIVVTVTNLSDSPADQKADWLTANGLLANSDWNSDPNNVGYSLTTAYAFGLSPSVNSGAPVVLASSSVGSLKIVYLQREGISGVTYTVKSGTDLAEGLNGTEIPQESANQPVPAKPGYTQYEATYTPLAPATKGFLKVQAVVP
jgi:autotransporter-associated beta strand protein